VIRAGLGARTGLRGAGWLGGYVVIAGAAVIMVVIMIVIVVVVVVVVGDILIMMHIIGGPSVYWLLADRLTVNDILLFDRLERR
jgi:hypothetical protein